MFLPLLASAESSGVTYRYNSETKTASVAYNPNNGSGSNYYGDIVIPEEVTYDGETYIVTGIDDQAFTWCSELTSIVLPKSLKTIGLYGFAGCSGLTSITFPEGLTTIANYAFSDCTGLTSVTIPSSVTSLGEDVFRRCTNLTSVTLHLAEVGKYAFSNLPSITELILGDEVTTTGYRSFQNCTGLTSVTIPNSMTIIGERVFEGCSGLASIIIPNSVTSIGDNAFEGCSGLASITLSEGLTKIGAEAFKDCNALSSLTIPSTVTGISYGAWLYCSSLTDVYCLPTGVPFGANATKESYPNVILHVPAESVEQYKNKNIYNTYKEVVASTSTNIQFTDEAAKAACVRNWDTDGDSELSFAEVMAVTDMESTFSQEKAITSFDEIRFFRNLTTIGKETFLNCSGLTSITIPKSVTAIGVSAFVGCSALTSIKVENGNTVYDSRNNCNAIITTADNVLVAGCKKTVIPADVTAIGDYAFSGCQGMRMAKIPGSVVSIGANAFSGCSQLKMLYCFAETLPETGSDLFGDTPIGAATLFVTNAELYKAASPWNGFMTIVDMDIPIPFADGNAKSICVQHWDTNGDGELSYGEAETVTMVGDINNNIFNGSDISTFDELQYFTGLKEIGMSAFNGSRVTAITIPESVVSIGPWAFMGCHRLTTITLPGNLTFIDNMGFHYSEELAKVYCYAEMPPTANGSFESASIGTATLYVPEGSIEAYKAAEPWSQFGKIVAIGSVEMVPYAVYNDGTLTFYCDENKESRGGYDPGPFNSSYEERWGGHIEDITTVVFDDSFANCTTLTSMANWFYGFKNLSSITGISNLKTDNVTDMWGMFYNCSSLTSLDVTGFKTENVTSMGWMFSGCSGLKTIYAGDGWSTSMVQDGNNMFYGCTSLVGGVGTRYDESHTDYTYARIDGGADNPGYFSPISAKIHPINEETTVNPSDDAKPGKTVITDDGLVISLGESDIVDKEDGSVTVTTVMTPDEVKGLLEQTKPDEPKFYNKFRGMYSMLAAGRGRMEITFQTLGDYDFIVMQGTDKVARYKQDEKGTVTVEYDVANNEWVFFFPTVSAAARAKMGREAMEGGLVIYSIKFIPDGITPGDANGDGTVNAADIVEVVSYIMGTPSGGFNETAADANGDGTVNAADIVAIVNIIMGN